MSSGGGNGDGVVRVFALLLRLLLLCGVLAESLSMDGTIADVAYLVDEVAAPGLKSTSADVGVFCISEATDLYEALHLFEIDIVDFGHFVTSVDKSGVVANQSHRYYTAAAVLDNVLNVSSSTVHGQTYPFT
ncbi:hypothetical protein Aduo_009041 [Ancylostoma duodenale]